MLRCGDVISVERPWLPLDGVSDNVDCTHAQLLGIAIGGYQSTVTKKGTQKQSMEYVRWVVFRAKSGNYCAPLLAVEGAVVEADTPDSVPEMPSQEDLNVAFASFDDLRQPSSAGAALARARKRHGANPGPRLGLRPKRTPTAAALKTPDTKPPNSTPPDSKPSPVVTPTKGLSAKMKDGLKGVGPAALRGWATPNLVKACELVGLPVLERDGFTMKEVRPASHPTLPPRSDCCSYLHCRWLSMH